MANLKSTTIADTGFLQLPTGTTAQRPQSPAAGEIRFNTDTKVAEWYDDQLDAWFPTGVIPPVATGGDTVEDINIDGVTYRIHSFTSVGSSTFTVTRGGEVEYLIVAGGGGGGSAGTNNGKAGGGGGGGVLTGSYLTKKQSYSLTVGAGGSAGAGGDGVTAVKGNSGENSAIFGFITFGGGGGGAGSDNNNQGLVGGSGGGAGSRQNNAPGGNSVPGQGNVGGLAEGGSGSSNETSRWAGGGGGAGEPGKNAQPGTSGYSGGGGNGIALLFTQQITFYGGGAGGATALGGINAGDGGGVNASNLDSGSVAFENGFPGQTATGAGGGGAFGGREVTNGSSGGDGGSGIVIIRYRIS